MLKNYFKTAWRSLVKNRFYSIVNISGLTVGLAVGIIILLWVQDEFSYDKFNSKHSQIYKLENMVGTGSSRQLWRPTASPIGVLAKKQVPGVEDAVRISYNGYYGLFGYGDKLFQERRPFFVDPSLFSVFDFPLIKGDARNPFPDNHSVVMTATAAEKYFGKENPIGKVIVADSKENFKVTGIINDIPKNSSLQPELLFPMSLLEEKMYADNKEGRNLENDFHQFNYQTFLLINPKMKFAGFTSKLRDMHLAIKPDDTDIEYVVMPLEKMHLFHSDGSEGGYSIVRMFMIIAIIILAIACINYINLSTARSMLRAKEVSLRKIVGAARFQLFAQFVIETTVLFLFATALALLLVFLLIPSFNSLSGKQLVLDFTSLSLWKTIFFTILGTLIVSSIYPALLLSSFEPLKAIRGRIAGRISNAVFRKALVVVQFSFSVILIAGALIIGKQMSFIRSRQLGFDKEHVLAVNTLRMTDHLDAVKNELKKEPAVQNITAASMNVIWYDGHTGNNNWDGKQPGETLMISPMAVDSNFTAFFDMKMKEGETFKGSIADSNHFILNETAVKAARIENPVGKKFKLWDTEGTIIGVVKDFHFSSMRSKIEPAVFYYKPKERRVLYVKTTAEKAPQAIAALKKQWGKYNAGFDFSYAFLDDDFNRLYESEQRTGSLFNIFSIIAIFISCLGLFGLATYTAQVRTREIGVRKVLGASVTGIARLLTLDFVKLVLISIIIGVPVTWYLMNKWLQDFAYKTEIGWVVFATTGVLAVLIAVATLSMQSIRAALMDPVKSLRNE